MANRTITVDDATLKRARLRALERNKSVNACLAQPLRRYADAGEADEKMARVLTIAEASTARNGPDGRAWTRDELHGGRLLRHQRGGLCLRQR
ncbi:MAG TPA: hypothetical protein PKH97_05970 [Tetrasphaera sp.]|uniref:hypothetical protein n=1 Tax=Nostocoides sp. TaxID=1917966 RepID=UPI002C7DDB8D|nr:hypothetical protein [Tetrasphaera sp.]HNQ06718.1 hypothetical protein [Tetrasphaera sp.]